MKRIALVLGMLMVASGARAESQGTGLTLGARLAYGLPYGDANTGLALRDYAGATVPVIVEAGYRFTKQLSASAYFQYAHAAGSSSACAQIPAASKNPASSCTASSGQSLRYGVEAAYRFPLQALTPWVAIGVGGERTETTSTVHIPASAGSPAFNGDVTVGRATAFIGELSLHGGVEWALAPGLSVGPFATLTFARYGDATLSPDPWGVASGIPSSDRTWHEWLQLGVKGTFDL